MAGKLLIETMPVTLQIVEQASQNNKGRLKVRGIFGVPDEPTGNGNIYPEAVMDREIEKLNVLIEDAAGWSEADHPGDGKSTIKNTAARFTKKIEKVTLEQLRKSDPALCLRFKDDPGTKTVYISEAMILRTEPGGKNLQEMIETGGRVDVSQRGFGSTLLEKWNGSGKWKGQDVNHVQEDYSLKTFDFVVGGATRGATVTELREQQMEIVNLIETGPCGDCPNKTKGGASTMKLVEQMADQIVKNLFSGSPKVENVKPEKPITETQQTSTEGDPKYLTEDSRDRMKVVVELLVSKHRKKFGRPLTESEETELIRHIREDSCEGRKLTLLETIQEDYPDAEIEAGFNDRVFFQSGRNYFMAGYLIEDGKAKLSGIEEVQLCFVRRGTLKPSDRGLLSPLAAALTEREAESRRRDLRVAGLEKPPQIKIDPIDPKQVTEQMHKDRRVAGLE